MLMPVGARSFGLFCATSLVEHSGDSARAAPQINEGVVVATGPGRRNKDGEVIPVSVKEGDKVLLPEYGGSSLKMDTKE